MAAYRIDVVSLMPGVFAPFIEYGVIGRAFESGIAELHTHNPRDYALDPYKKVDDLPYGGGAGMLLKPEPYFAAFEAIPLKKKKRVLLMSPQGTLLVQNDLIRWSTKHEQVIILCGQYEGFDERIRTLCDEEISIGDYVLTGGEIPAMTVINGLVRLLPGTVSKTESLEKESHSEILLEHPHYTRPAEFRGMKVPEVLRSGDHKAIHNWREEQSIERTKANRRDLYEKWISKSKGAQMHKIESKSET